MLGKRELKEATALAALGIAEALWPTRCAVCDMPGATLCEHCLKNLPYLDQLTACPVCGSAWGKTVCCECNRETLRQRGLERFPLDGCVAATRLTPETHRIVIAYKDRGEQRLARVMAERMADVMPPAWRRAVAPAYLVPIPARTAAIRRRGFDHAALLVRELQAHTGMTTAALLRPCGSRDQRALGAQGRMGNMRGSFRAARRLPNAAEHRFILVDDVITTGATLFAAAEALRNAGATEVCGLAFTRA